MKDSQRKAMMAKLNKSGDLKYYNSLTQDSKGHLLTMGTNQFGLKAGRFDLSDLTPKEKTKFQKSIQHHKLVNIKRARDYDSDSFHDYKMKTKGIELGKKLSGQNLRNRIHDLHKQHSDEYHGIEKLKNDPTPDKSLKELQHKHQRTSSELAYLNKEVDRRKHEGRYTTPKIHTNSGHGNF